MAFLEKTFLTLRLKKEIAMIFSNILVVLWVVFSSSVHLCLRRSLEEFQVATESP